MSNLYQEDHVQSGRWLSSPPPGEEVVISGISGRFPNCNNVQEFQENLFNKVDMTSPSDQVWKVDNEELPIQFGKIPEIDKCDAGYFGLHYRQANNMDASLRILMETTIEAIFDAGVNPSDLKGTKTGVFTAVAWSDLENRTVIAPNSFAIQGYIRSMLARRISNFLHLNGPSFTVDTACSSVMNAFHLAFQAIRLGKCDNALVGAGNLILNPNSSMQFLGLGVLSRKRQCTVFDETADGYIRAETVGCLFLQKSKDARRIYTQVVYAKSNTDGYKKFGITFPSSIRQYQLLSESYEETEINLNDISYVEAHGTGTTIGDPQECFAIDEALTKKRNKQLLIGSVKSSIGHAEPASGLTSIIKCIIAMETNLIPPTINLTNVKKEIVGVIEGRMKIVTELTPLEDDEAIMSVNNFGFGGSNVHVILKRPKNQVNNLKINDFPKLVCVSQRTEESLLYMLHHLGENVNDEVFGLLHQIYKNEIKGHLFRGFIIIANNKVIKTSVKLLKEQTPICVEFYCLKKFKTLGTALQKLHIFANFSKKLENVLSKYDTSFCNLQDEILGSLCVYIGIVDIFKQLELKVTIMKTGLYGRVAEAYFKNQVTLDDVILIGFKHMSLENKNDLNYDPTPETNRKNVVNFLEINDELCFLEMLGRFYQKGHNFQIQKLFPEIKYPVSRGTPMISPLIRWKHNETWKCHQTVNELVHEKSTLFSTEEYRYIIGHIIDRRNLFPATEYLTLVWKTFVKMNNKLRGDVPVMFENCKFLKAIVVQEKSQILLTVSIKKPTGNFQISENDLPIVTGSIRYCSTNEFTNLKPIELEKDQNKLITCDEIYREFNIRGYNYSGMFKGIETCNSEATAALIKWENQYTTFIDQMLQLKILQVDTRSLYIPVSIKKLIIDPGFHLHLENKLLPVSYYKENNIIKSGGIEINGLQAQSINKKKSLLKPILEKHIFVPNVANLEESEAFRVNAQIILENNSGNSFKAVEIVDNCTNSELPHLMPLLCKALNDVPAIIPDLTICTTLDLEEIPGVTISNAKLNTDAKLHLIVASKVLQRPEYLQDLFELLSNNGYILTREDLNCTATSNAEIQCVTEYTNANEKLILLQKYKQIETFEYVEISNNFDWILKLKDALAEKQNIAVVAKEKNIGILGLINCLRREVVNKKVHCYFLMDVAPDFNPQLEFYHNQMKKNLAINIYKNRTWGTYRHMLLDEVQEVECEHSFANVLNMGDLSSYKWLQGHLSSKNCKDLVHVYYSSINFKDVLLATGRINVDSYSSNRKTQHSLLGSEYSGLDASGRRVMGIIMSKSFSSLIEPHLLWEVPDHWSLEDAATVPFVYLTVLFPIKMIIRFKPNISVLIHSATGGVGLAALNICLHHKCEIFVTVGTQKKRDYLRKHYPQIPESHIGNSRDTSFENMIKKETKGRGVDIVINSLSEEKLKTTIRCLAAGGDFIEIGKFDLANNADLELLFLKKNINFHSVMMDRVYQGNYQMKQLLIDTLNIGIEEGYIRPLPRVVFDKQDIEKANRYMMTGQHIGKVMIKLRNEENMRLVKPQKTLFKSLPWFTCNSQSSYIIIGGLGGVGLELADWLVLRGALKLVLVSRTGIQSGYPLQRIKAWKTFGVETKISTLNVTTREGCNDLIVKANKFGSVDGIFNLAVVLKDSLFEDQTEESFDISFKPKVLVTAYLDEISRKLCPNLRYFVVFSSVSCGLGNAGQTNYGMANSIMERICEQRKEENLPAIAIQWGAIGEVGLVAKMQKENKELVIGGTLQQKISSCMEVLDVLLNQDSPIVSSMVVAEKHAKHNKLQSAVETVAYFLGINIKTVDSQATFAELGVDSMAYMEVVHLLSTNFDIHLSAKDLRNTSFNKLAELAGDNVKSTKNIKTSRENFFARYVPEKSDLKQIRLVSQVEENAEAPTVFCLTGIEGVFQPLQVLSKQLQAHVIGLQYSYHEPEETVQNTAQNLFLNILSDLSKDKINIFICYSFGCVIGVELVSILESHNYKTEIIAIDGSPTYIQKAANKYFPNQTDEEIKYHVFDIFLSKLVPNLQTTKFDVQLQNCKTPKDRLALTDQILQYFNIEQQPIITIYIRVKAVCNYTLHIKKLNSAIHLFKANIPIAEEEEDYQLSKICENRVNVTTIDGDHYTMLSSPKLGKDINNIITKVYSREC